MRCHERSAMASCRCINASWQPSEYSARNFSPKLVVPDQRTLIHTHTHGHSYRFNGRTFYGGFVRVFVCVSSLRGRMRRRGEGATKHAGVGAFHRFRRRKMLCQDHFRMFGRTHVISTWVPDGAASPVSHIVWIFNITFAMQTTSPPPPYTRFNFVQESCAHRGCSASNSDKCMYPHLSPAPSTCD